MATPLVAGGALAGALAIHSELLARLRPVDGPTPPWWFGYARDATNLSACLMCWGAYLGLGLAPAVAFLAAALTTLGTYLLDWVLARGLRLRYARLALAIPLACWVVFAAARPQTVDRGFEWLIAAAQPRH
ncbi:MAG: hypothetical protein JWN44_1780 [Myxococcales bacterium]|nr:hypothetical protein [Myxococcales bacterium]